MTTLQTQLSLFGVVALVVTVLLIALKRSPRRTR
jgi:hypothetical protein